jgi:hypothetical protein
MAGTIMTPGGTTGGNLESWKRKFEVGTYQRLKFIPTIDEGDRPYTLGHHRKFTRVTGSTLGQSADGTGLTYLNILGTPVTATPVGSVVPIAWSRNERAQIDINLGSEGRGEIEQALAELTETGALANIQSATEGISVADVDGPALRKAQANLYGNTNGVVEPGVTTMYGIFSHTQLPNLQGIEEYNKADVRGDSENPYVKGVWTKGQGILLLTTTVVANDLNGWHNALYVSSGFTIDWNERSGITEDSAELQERLIAYNNVATAVLNNPRIFYVRTTNSAL